MKSLYVFLAVAAMALALTANGASAKSSGSAAVIHDCTRHPSGLIHKHTLSALRTARRTLPAPVATYTDCVVDIKSQMAGYIGRLGKQSANSALQDCAKHGYLRLRYRSNVLKRARKTIPPDLDDYTRCRQALTSQLSLVRAR
jgi:hypothetical protein